MRPARCLPILVLAASIAAGPAGAWPTDPAVNQPVCAASGDQGAPRAVSAGPEEAFVAWWDGRNGGQIFAQRLSGTGEPLWAVDGVALSPPGATSDPMIVPDGGGGAVIAWIEDSGDSRSLRAQRLGADGAARWSGGVTVRSRTDHLEEIGFSRWYWTMATAASDGAGGMYLAFHERHEENNPIDPSRHTSEILVLHCDGEGVVSEDVVVASDLYLCSFCGDGFFHMDQYSDLALAHDGGSAPIVAYRLRRIFNHGTVYFPAEIRVAAPIAGWGVTAATATQDVRRPRVASDGGGGAWVSWEDQQAGLVKLRAARFGSTGAPLWAAGGVPVCASSGDQTAQEMVADAGGLTLAWLDLRNGGSPDVFVQRLGPDGAPLWGSEGVALCTAPTAERTLAIARTTDGSTAVVWRDVRGAAGDLYANMVSPLGVPRGSVDGDAVTYALGEQDAPAIAPTGIDATVAWRDRRGSSADVYAQRIGARGPVSGPPVIGPPSFPPPELALSLVAPNPSQGETLIRFHLPREMDAALWIADVRGRLVATIRRGALPPGMQEARWDGRDDRGRDVGAGVYVVVMDTSGARLTRRLAIVR